MMLRKAYSIQVVNPEYKEFIYNLGVKNPNIFVEDVTSASETENGVKNSLIGKILGRPGYLNIKKV